MDDLNFDIALRHFTEQLSRRSITRQLAGSAISGVLGIVGLSDSGAKKRKKRKKRKKKTSPLPTTTVRCDSHNADRTARRFAQTFIAPGSGTPTSAEVLVKQNPDNLVLEFEILTVPESGVPSQAVVLASGITGYISLTDSTNAPRRLSASFSNVALSLAAGQRYALVVTGSVHWGIYYDSSGDPCPEGMLFEDGDDFGEFIDVGGNSPDMVFAVTITG